MFDRHLQIQRSGESDWDSGLVGAFLRDLRNGLFFMETSAKTGLVLG